MSDSKSKLVENLLAKPDMHRQWEGGYRTADNERFFEQAFDYIAQVLRPPEGATFLDVGCGSCAHSVRLARRGFNVRAVDFSESALGMAGEHLKAQGLADKITLGRENILELSFPDESFDYVICWGVLMHIPDVERAVAELSRVVKPGGFLVVSEGNMSSLEAVGLRGLKRVLGKEKAEVKRTPAGMEYWKSSGDGALVTRQADIEWLVKSFEQRGMRLARRVAGQFSEGYAMVSSRPLKRLIHGLNNFWFRYVGLPRLTYGNILFMQKRK
jgi:ubiquinone/menaquinone biosynthesis C-methylase UbiE